MTGAHGRDDGPRDEIFVMHKDSRWSDRLQNQMYAAFLVALAAIIIAIGAAALSWGEGASLKTILPPVVNTQVSRDLRSLSCRVLADRVDGKIVISCVQAGGRP